MKYLWIWLSAVVLVGCTSGRGYRETDAESEKSTAAAKHTATQKTAVKKTKVKKNRTQTTLAKKSSTKRATPPKTTKPPSVPSVQSDHGLFDGSTGADVTLSAFAKSARDADLIAFGEIHRDVVGSRVQLQLLKELAAQSRPVVLAMEFFERDTQKVVDQYLADEITEEQFMDWSRQKSAYTASHRPLIEFCKKQGIPVIAANAPRTLVSEYRKQKYPYPEFLETLSEDEVLFLPKTTTELNDEEKERFAQFMGGHGPADLGPFMKSMALWDDAMAEAAAEFRTANPKHRVLLIVGMFHVMKKMGTVRKFLERRPDDRVRSLIMVSSGAGAATFAKDDGGLGDVILKVRRVVVKTKQPQGESK